jgi:hypothetical protein
MPRADALSSSKDPRWRASAQPWERTLRHTCPHRVRGRLRDGGRRSAALGGVVEPDGAAAERHERLPIETPNRTHRTVLGPQRRDLGLFEQQMAVVAVRRQPFDD